VSSTVLVTDTAYARDLALAVIGVGYVFEPLVNADVVTGRLGQQDEEACKPVEFVPVCLGFRLTGQG
jgi:hypothetical protein